MPRELERFKQRVQRPILLVRVIFALAPFTQRLTAFLLCDQLQVATDECALLLERIAWERRYGQNWTTQCGTTT